jgi:hypothetical protein
VHSASSQLQAQAQPKLNIISQPSREDLRLARPSLSLRTLQQFPGLNEN